MNVSLYYRSHLSTDISQTNIYSKLFSWIGQESVSTVDEFSGQCWWRRMFCLNAFIRTKHVTVCDVMFVVCAQPQVLPPSLKDNLLDFGVRSATHTSSIIFVVVNSNPIEVR